jgi:ribosomal protein S24E
MELKIDSQEKSVLPRQDITATVTFGQVTPSRKELKKALAKKAGVKEELIIVRNIYTEYGERKAFVKAYAYDNEEALKNVEYDKAIEKNKSAGPKKEEKTEEAPAEKKEDKSEEKKEEAKPREKPEDKEEPKKEEKPASEDKKEGKGE